VEWACAARAPEKTLDRGKSSNNGTRRLLRRYVSFSQRQNAILSTFMTESLGGKRWAIAERYIPSRSSFSDPALVSHETACILNAGAKVAHLRIAVFFADREPVGPYLVTVAARRTLHLRFNDLEKPEPVPRDTAYSTVFESDVPIIVQRTRLDSRHAELSLLSTIAYAEE
jgi:hypothetical protein